MKPVSVLLPSCIFNFYFPLDFFSGTIEELRMCILTILDRTPSYQPSAAAAPAAAKLKSSNLLPNANFVGRQAELQQIGDLMEGYNKLFLQGMGGIGKSELAKAKILSRMGQGEEALALCRRVIDLQTQLNGEDHQLVLNRYETLGDIYASMGQTEKAILTFRELCEKLDKRLDTTTPFRQRINKKLAVLI